MTCGIFLNLFEIDPPSEFQIMAFPWSTEIDVKQLRRHVLPAFLYASNHTKHIYCYGQDSEKTVELGFHSDTVGAYDDPRLTGRILLDAITNHLITQFQFDLQHRPHTAKVHEVTDYQSRLDQIEKRIDVYPSYKIQTVFLKVAGELRYFLMVRPRARYRFSHKLAKIQEVVNLAGRYVRLNCPSDCTAFKCDLYDYRHQLAGPFAELKTDQSFRCEYLNIGGADSQSVVFAEGSRFGFNLPLEICELEASVANISAIMTARLDAVRASKVITDLRVATGDLLPSSPRSVINTQVGQRRYQEIAALLAKLTGDISVFGKGTFHVSSDPIQGIEGGLAPEETYFDEDTPDGSEAEEHDDSF
jgi:hypothetical protein